MRVWLLQIGEPLPLDRSVRKLRTALMADEFIRAGHEVIWWASAFEHQRKKLLFEDDQDLHINDRYVIRALKGLPYSRNVSLKRYIDHRIVAKKFKVAARADKKPDVIVASMPSYDLAYEAVSYAKSFHVPVIIDVRDMWPDIIIDRFSGPARAFAKLFLAKDFKKLRYLLSSASGISAMSDGVLAWALNHADRERDENDRVFYLGYSARKAQDIQNIGDHVNSLLRALLDKRICIFIGTHGHSYELDLLLDVAKRIEMKRDLHLHFVIAGKGENSERLREKAVGMTNVSFTGWLNADEIAKLMSKAYMGIAPCRSVIDAYPNKPIEYLSAGLPIVSSIEGELAELIDNEGIGLNYKAGDVSGLEDCMLKLAMNEEIRDRMSINAKRVFTNRFDAERIYGSYVKYVEAIASKR